MPAKRSPRRDRRRLREDLAAASTVLRNRLLKSNALLVGDSLSQFLELRQ